MPAKTAAKVKVPVMPYYGDEEMTLDFPTLERPIRVTKPDFKSGVGISFFALTIYSL